MTLDNPILLLALIVAVGEAIGRVELKSFSLGSSAVVFVALAFGHFGYRLPTDLQLLGLVLFVYSIGMEAGPGFIGSFRRHGLRLSLGALAMVAAATATAVSAAWLAGFDAGTAAGLLAGAMTSTPGLAVAVERADPAAAASAYGVTYVFGVVGVIVAVRLLPRVLGVDIPAEETAVARELSQSNPPVEVAHFTVTNPNIFDKTVAGVRVTKFAPVTITRLVRRGESIPELVAPDTALREGDRCRIVGRAKDLETIGMLIGERTDEPLDFERELAARDVVVSRPEAIGVPLGALNLRLTFNVQVGRVTRHGIDLPADAGLRLIRGDVLRVVGDERSIRNVAKVFGNDANATNTASLLAIALGAVAGFALGALPLTLPGIGSFTLGTTGGVLVTGLVFGALHKTGPLIWDVPTPINTFMRDAGLLLFLAVVGTRAGGTIVATLADQGLPLVAAGTAVTLVPIGVSLWVCRRLLGIDFLRMLGVIAGGMTSTPGLATATSLSSTPHPASAYATVYPVALVAMIVAVKLVTLFSALWS